MCIHGASVILYSFVNSLLEDGLWSPKHVGGESQNNKWLFMVTYAVSSIKYRIASLLHGIRITLIGGITDDMTRR